MQELHRQHDRTGAEERGFICVYAHFSAFNREERSEVAQHNPMHDHRGMIMCRRHTHTHTEQSPWLHVPDFHIRHKSVYITIIHKDWAFECITKDFKNSEVSKFSFSQFPLKEQSSSISTKHPKVALTAMIHILLIKSHWDKLIFLWNRSMFDVYMLVHSYHHYRHITQP